MLRSAITFYLALTTMVGTAQFIGAGLVVAPTVYERYVNSHVLGANGAHSSGSALNIPGLGGKLWLGNKEIKLSFEGRVHFAPAATHFKAWDEFSGLGAVSFPVLAKLNMYGPELNYFTQEPGPTSPWTDKHWSIGGGVQFTKTDLYLRPDDAVAERKMFRTYVLAFEFGITWGTGMWMDSFIEYGLGEQSSSTFRIGVASSFDFVTLISGEEIGVTPIFE